MENNLNTIVLTNEILEQGKSRNGGYSSKQLEIFGIEKFYKGWKKELVGKSVSLSLVEDFIKLKDAHLSQTQPNLPHPPLVQRDLSD
jgi:hypothetical protein